MRKATHASGFDCISELDKDLGVLLGIFAPNEDFDGMFLILELFEVFGCSVGSAWFGRPRWKGKGLSITFLGGGDNVESIEGEHHQCGRKFVT